MPDDYARNWSKSDRRQTVEETSPAKNWLVSVAERNFAVNELRTPSAQVGNADVDSGRHLCPVECAVLSCFSRLLAAIEVRASECFELGLRRPATSDFESESITDKTRFTLTARVRKK